MRRACAIVAITASTALVVSCAGRTAARDQWLITISTDGPVPAIADRLLVEILQGDGSACSGCTRTFGLGEGASLPLSFGIEPSVDGTLLVRATLFRKEQSGADGRPVDTAHLEALGVLPQARGVTPVSLNLPMSCFGVPVDAVAHTTCDRSTRAPSAAPLLQSGPSLVTGSWPDAATTDCPMPAPDGMVCIPGGVFLMGSHDTVTALTDELSYPEHLVRTSPFHLDTLETSVGDVRALLRSGALLSTLTPIAKNDDATTLAGGCTYVGLDDATNDSLPVNCITFASAAGICAALGKRLPTEAEWELAARNRDASSTYPWGEDPDVCGFAAVALGRSNATTASDVYEFNTCRNSPNGQLPWGPVNVGSSAKDVTTLGVRDLGGNVAEWLSDRYQRYDETCWTGGAPDLVAPSCDEASPDYPSQRSIRGGAWTFEANYANGATRNATNAINWFPGLGVRCARSP